jgi:hypothetical protein
MHAALAAVVLAASPSPSPSPSGHSGLDWGDVPAWVAAVATVVGLTAAITGALIAYRQFRQQTDVLKGEIERNKRRDELLDGQVEELRERADERAREQAEGVSVWWESAQGATVYNESRRPIARVSASVLVSVPEGGYTTHRATSWTLLDLLGEVYDGGGGTPRAGRSNLEPVVRSKNRLHFTFEDLPFRNKTMRLLIRFDDDARRRWELDEFGHLEPAPPDRW